MKNYAKLPYFVFFSVIVLMFACNQADSSKNKETILKGSTTIYVDETLTPIIEDQVAVFESKYEAKIKLISKSESETVNSLFNEKAAIAILSRNLTNQELKIFDQRKIVPKVTVFATDAVAFISNKNNNDTIVALKDVISFMQGKPVASIKGLVFDNPNSSTVRYMKELAKVKEVPSKNVFSFKFTGISSKFKPASLKIICGPNAQAPREKYNFIETPLKIHFLLIARVCNI